MFLICSLICRYANLKQLCHEFLGEPYGFLFQVDFDFGFAAFALVDDELGVGFHDVDSIFLL
jgi:hypothetical protein